MHFATAASLLAFASGALAQFDRFCISPINYAAINRSVRQVNTSVRNSNRYALQAFSDRFECGIDQVLIRRAVRSLDSAQNSLSQVYVGILVSPRERSPLGSVQNERSLSARSQFRRCQRNDVLFGYSVVNRTLRRFNELWAAYGPDRTFGSRCRRLRDELLDTIEELWFQIEFLKASLGTCQNTCWNPIPCRGPGCFPRPPICVGPGCRPNILPFPLGPVIGNIGNVLGSIVGVPRRRRDMDDKKKSALVEEKAATKETSQLSEEANKDKDAATEETPVVETN